MCLAEAIMGAGLLSAGSSLGGALFGASAQTKAAEDATRAQLAMFNTIQRNLSPYMSAGQNALTQALQMAQGGFNFSPTMAQLEQTPGYQFNLSQGLKSVQNSAAARGLGTSGAAMRGAADYASGLAANTYQQQFTNALQQYQTNFGNLASLASLGENAAAGVGNAATATGAQIGSNMIGAGNAQAAAAMAAANGISGAGNNALMAYLLATKLNTGLLGSSGTPVSAEAQYA